MIKIYPTILCGGSGTRLWPLSRTLHPKQFMDIGTGQSLFDGTLERVDLLRQALQNVQESIIFCNEEHRFLAASSLQQKNMQGKIYLEPVGRNTAPAIALAALAVLDMCNRDDEEAMLLVLPSDHILKPQESFNAAIAKTLDLADYLISFGIKPSSPETGFGYIKQGAALKSGFMVDKFVEKPALDKAKQMLTEGGYYWNSGIFAFKAKNYLAELQKYAPNIYDACLKCYTTQENHYDFTRFNSQAFESIPSESIDYAVMEHSQKVAFIPLDLHWNDLGNWEAFKELNQQDSNGNYINGDVMLEDSKNCFVHSSSRLVATIGLEDITIIESDDAVLVSHRSRVQDTKNIVNKLKAQKRPEAENHTLVHRPWGYYQSIGLGERFQVKRIVVNPNAELSLQMHHHRAEHWVVVRGTGEVTAGDEKVLLHEDQSIYIPLGTVHRLKNPGRIPLEIIEVQSGTYLGEDDIIRLEDNYSRK